MNERPNTLLVVVDKENEDVLIQWKRECLYKYGSGGIKKRTQEIILEDLKKLKAK